MMVDVFISLFHNFSAAKIVKFGGFLLPLHPLFIIVYDDRL